jgi:O-antigen/teichoic acid export membrane protein
VTKLAGRFKLSPRLVMLAAFGGTSALNYAFGLMMGWMLGPGDFGLLAFVQTLLLIGGMVTNYTFSLSLARAVIKTKDPDERDAVVRGTMLANLALAVVIAAVLLSLFAAGPLQGGFERWPVAVIVALCFPFISLISTIGGCAEGFERWGFLAALIFVEMLCKALSGVALVLLGYGALGAITGFLVGAVGASAFGFYLLKRGLGVRLRGSARLPDVRAAAAIFGTMFGLSMLLNLDLAGLKLLADERATVGFYQAGLVLAAAPYYLVLAAIMPVLFVQLARHDDVASTRGTVGETLGLTAALILPFEVVLIALPEQALLLLFPDVYAAGAPALRLLAIANALLVLTAIFSTVFQAIGRASVPAFILLAVTLAEPLALWAVVPRWQAMGAAWVFVGAGVLALSGLVAAYLRGAGTESLWQAAPWVARYLLSVGAGLAGGGAVLGLGAAPAVAVGGTCYLLAATLLRVVRPFAMLPGAQLAARGEE